MKIKKYKIFTYGCQANLADSERITQRLEIEGCKKTEDAEKANIIVINACSVKQAVINRLHHKINKFSKKRIIIAGCVLEKDKKRFEKEGIEIWHPDEYFNLTPVYSNSTTANVPITTGCNNFCSYCAVPYTRGRERSRPAKEIVNEVKYLIKNNSKEIWLLGQNVNSYKSKKIDFADLLQMINALPRDFWVRFTSPHPKDFSDKLIKTMTKCQKFPHYLNLPIQSGNNTILKKMNRPYTVGHYKKLVKKIRKNIPDISLSTDIIVGFPGETKKQFEDTIKLFKEIKFDMAFISEYSPRPGTIADKKFKDDVPAKEKIRRKNELNEVLKKTALENNKKLVGKTLRVLNNKTEGNKLVIIDGKDSKNKFINIKITKAEAWKLYGESLKQNSAKVIVISGPTSSGKSNLAVKLALRLRPLDDTQGKSRQAQKGGEIISADSRQVYKGLDIGSGKITKKEMKSIPHYCIDYISPKKRYSVIDFKKCANKAIKDILSRNKTPIICGGTGFYIDALLGKINFPEVPPNSALRKKLEKKSTEQLFKMLQKLDPKRAKNIDAKNPIRLIRSIEIAKALGEVPKIKTKVIDYSSLQIGVKLSEAEFKKNIEKRITKMIKDGLVAETKKLHNQPSKGGQGLSWKRIYELGFEYKYPALFLQDKITKEEMLERMLIENYQYAKRQMTWFKRDKQIKWLNSPDIKKAEELVRKFL